MTKTFTYENKLPTLPIPPITSTEEKLQEWIQPLLTENEFQQSKAEIKNFFKPGGNAELLQRKLQEWNAENGDSWLKPLWDDLYLKYRGALPTGMNFNILLDNKNYMQQYSQTAIAGKVCRFVTEFYHKIVDGKIDPVKLDKVPLDMSQYKYFFRSARIPQKDKDHFTVAPFDKTNNTIAILANHHVYKIETTDQFGNMYSSEQLTSIIEKTLSNETANGQNVGIYTTAKREDAAKVYNQLLASPVNKEIIQMIENALIVLSLDDDSETSEEAISNLMLNGNNKFYDKTIQAVITKNGLLGYSIEHTAVDGTTIFSVIKYVNDGLSKKLKQQQKLESVPSMPKMEWALEEKTKTLLRRFQSNHEQVKDNFHIQLKVIENFGAGSIKRMNLSPDAFFHMALQLAQYRTFGKFRSVYEPVSMRIYQDGRTECARATSTKKSNLVYAIESGKHSDKKIYALMKKAGADHSARIIQCRNGFGVERHMYGLEEMYNRFGKMLGMHEKPAMFEDEGYLTLRRDFISTSGMAYDNVKYRIFGPVVESGFGLAYILLEDSISMNLSYKTPQSEDAKKLINHLAEALVELKDIAEGYIKEIPHID